MKLKKILLFFVMACFCSGTINFVMAESKKPRNTTVYLEKKHTNKGSRSGELSVIAIFSADGNSVSLNISEDCECAYVTISGGSAYFTDMINVNNGFATLDISYLEVGLYYINIELENGSIYSGEIEFL